MTFRIAMTSVIKGATSWLTLIVASVVLMVVVTLSLGLVVAGASTQGEAQEAYASMGGVSLGFTVLTGLASFRLVVSICVGLQRRDVALWQIVGVMPAAALAIMAIEVVLVTVISGLIGALVAVALWPGYASLVDGSGLPHSDVLAGPLPAPATVIGVATTAVVSLLSGLRSAKKTVRANLVASSQQDTPAHTTVGVKIATAMAALTLTAGAVTLYIVIGRTDRVTNPEQVAELLTSYPGMGLLDCLIFAVVAGPVTRFLTVTMKAVPAGIPGFLASREAAARPALTRALIVPITLAAAAVGVMSSWIKVVATVMDTSAPGTDSVSAPPRLMALLFGGPLIVACVCAASIVFATASHRRRDNALLAVSGATTRDIRTKIFVETAIYAVICLVCSYAIVITNEIAMATALSAGPAGSVPIQAPDWKAAAVVAFGISLTLVMLLMITTSGMRREPVAVVLGSRS